MSAAVGPKDKAKAGKKTKAQGTEEPRKDAERRSGETPSPNRQEMACESVGQQPVVAMTQGIISLAEPRGIVCTEILYSRNLLRKP